MDTDAKIPDFSMVYLRVPWYLTIQIVFRALSRGNQLVPVGAADEIAKIKKGEERRISNRL
jgi:hypothetical protein